MTAAENYPYPLRKLALIISNANYSATHNELNHSNINAERMSVLLNRICFDVHEYKDLDSNMMRTIQSFCDDIKDGDLILFYYSGHGCRVRRKSYFIPVDDDNITSEIDIQDKGIQVKHILQRLTEGHSLYGTVAILDCCKPYKLGDQSIASRKFNHLLHCIERFFLSFKL